MSWSEDDSWRSALGRGPLAAVLLVAATGCNAPEPPASTGGVDVPFGPCGRGVVVVGTDYQSTNVSLLGVDGSILSSSFVSAGSATTGLSSPLSGDVVVPTMPTFGDEIVLIDRYPAAVLTWMVLTTATVRAQLSVATGFHSNPQDYVAVDGEHKAYVSRYDANVAPGAEPHDEGSDVLVLDPWVPAVTGRIDLGLAMLPEEAEYLPRPARLARSGPWVFVLLAAYSQDFLDSAPSRLVTIDSRTDAIVAVTILDELHGCRGLAVSAAGARLAVTCSGKFAGGSTPSLAEAGVAVLSFEATGAVGDEQIELVEIRRWSAAALGDQAPGFAVDFAGDDRLLLTLLGQFGTAEQPLQQDALLDLPLEPGASPRVILQTEATPFELGEVRCLEACGRCFAADAERGVIHRLGHGDGGLAVDASYSVDTVIGLPPRLLGRF